MGRHALMTTIALLLALIPGRLPAQPAAPKDAASLDVFKVKVGDRVTPKWTNALPNPADINRLLTHPCFDYSVPYCMPKADGETGFVCSGQSASVVAHLASLGLPARPYYLEWENAKKETEAHAMVLVPFAGTKGEQCFHLLEVARTWPRQPTVELTRCLDGGPREGAALDRAIESATREHFFNPPAAEEAQKKGIPVRTPLTKGAHFSARPVDVPYDLTDRYNPGTPIWTLEKGKWACPNNLCTRHQVAGHITIDQSKVTPGDASTFPKTEIVIDYRKAQEFSCKQTCPAANCILRATGRQAPQDHPVNWPPTRATCRPAAVLRANVVHPQFSCRSICETPRADYTGGTYVRNVPEPAMQCAESGTIVHTVRRPEPKGKLAPDGSEIDRHAGPRDNPVTTR